MLSALLLPAATKLGQGNVCDSVHRGSVYLSACWNTTSPWSRPPGADPVRNRHPQSRQPTPQSRHPPGADTPLEQTPQSRYPPGADIPLEQTSPPEQTAPSEQTPPRADTPGTDPPEQTSPLKQTPPWSRQHPRADPPRSRHPLEQTPPPPRKHTTAYGQRAAGTHPTGMHSCYLYKEDTYRRGV